eukprot:TRINITY_DN2141_c0_g1_i1.p1 TRINITY_DN2141_c0_g1~~TRINITY_DN2141_c0_g1_i1.p1  ORF type:complete len:402 (-),score=165.26 TRINITY_DN2141_c0_g1_i1:31-1236(-)
MLISSSFRRAANVKTGKAQFSSAPANEPLKRTQLYPLHLKLQGQMVPFCGWEMPIQYPNGIIKPHVHTRESAGWFDVSHMLQLTLHGKDRVAFLESLTVVDLVNLAPNSSSLSVFTNEKGGIIDDTMITNAGNHIYVVVNAGCAEKDLAHISAKLKEWKGKGKDVALEIVSEKNSLVALQGPKAQEVVKTLLPSAAAENLPKMKFMSRQILPLLGVDCIVTRCGYTGEDGFEISVPHAKAVELSEKLLAHQASLPVGLGARDTLRLEAGLCLYGNDIDDSTTPIEAGLAWTISKRRRQEGGFPGAELILSQLKNGVQKKRVGVLVDEGIAREHTKIHNEKGEPIGELTSGTFSPILKKGIGMGYISTPFADTKTRVVLKGRRDFKGEVVKLPFVKTSYHKV